jgi:hypothetical protein
MFLLSVVAEMRTIPDHNIRFHHNLDVNVRSKSVVGRGALLTVRESNGRGQRQRRQRAHHATNSAIALQRQLSRRCRATQSSFFRQSAYYV